MRHMMLCGVLFATAVSASEPEPSPELESRRTFVGLVPIPLRVGLVAVDGERALSPKLSVRVGLRLGGGQGERRGDAGSGDDSYFGVGVEPGLRYYVTGTVLDGLWVGSHLELSRRWFQQESSTFTQHERDWSAGVATLVGYSMVVSRGVTVQAGVGLGASYTSSKTEGLNTMDPNQPGEFTFNNRSWGIAERATLALGWAF